MRFASCLRLTRRAVNHFDAWSTACVLDFVERLAQQCPRLVGAPASRLGWGL